MTVELQSTTTVFELFEAIKFHLKFEGSFKRWTCYSVSRQKWLNISEEIGNYQDEIFNVHMKPDLVSKFEKVETWNLKTIIIQPSNHNMMVELQSTTTVFELFEAIKLHFKFEGSFKQWICYSVSRQKQLNISEEIGNYQDEIFNVHIKSDLESQNEKVEDINIQIDIKDSGINRKFSTIFKSSDIIQSVAQATLSYCQLSDQQEVAAVDLFIFGQPYNDKIKRFKSFSDLQIKNNTTIEARIRWIGG
ncbi:unnamed protein product [Paramecium pentaurelia]|uniref:Ubiquitin-like domain-containing protein n=1 Tax=Paramecium pentaurelia TaxID=43138 RepID=A0A8S1U7Q8_9CILI|nr:unnamed protein product [Paramecium pentaurelia]